MKITQVDIHNFRGIVDARIALCDYSLLVGQNNAGKSTIIDALRAFYEKDGAKYKPEQDFPFLPTADKESWIEMTFTLSDEEWASLAEVYKLSNHTLRLRKYFQTTTKTHDDKAATGSIFGYRKDGSISNEPFYGAKNVQSGKIGDVVYIPAVSRLDEHTKMSGPSVLRDLLVNVLEDLVDDSPAFDQFNKGFADFAEKVISEETSDGRSLDKLQDQLDDLLGDWGVSFKLKLTAPSTSEIIKSMLSHHFEEKTHAKTLAADKFGSGFQRQFIYSLIQVGAQFAGKKSIKKSKDFAPSMMLILFEEPEVFLHPPQQEALAKSLSKLVETSNRQVICSTHSPHFVSKNTANIPSLIRVKRTNGYTQTCQVDNDRWSEVVESNQAINALAAKWPKMARKLAADDWKPEMESVKNFLWLNPDRCCMFFANHVLLVEGTAEQAFINRLIGDCVIPSFPGGLYVLDCLGKYNIHRFMNLLIALGISHSVLHDDDLEADEHKDLNELILASRDGALTVNVKTLRGNIETVLGIPSTSPHRKPQHLLYMYEHGQINKSCLSKFLDVLGQSLVKQ